MKFAAWEFPSGKAADGAYRGARKFVLAGSREGDYSVHSLELEVEAGGSTRYLIVAMSEQDLVRGDEVPGGRRITEPGFLELLQRLTSARRNELAAAGKVRPGGIIEAHDPRGHR